MSEVFFQPFVGKDYQRGGIFGKRIMVLGESHYCEEGCADCGDVERHPECGLFTNGTMRNYLDENYPREDWTKTFLKFERSLVGHETDWAERRKIWQSVLFFNYLQEAMSGPREAGTPPQYDRGSRAFYEVIDKYQPQYIIVWGIQQLWNYLPGDSRWHAEKPIVVDDYSVNTGSYTLKSGGEAKVMAVYHPSVGYSWDYWHRVIEEFLKR